MSNANMVLSLLIKGDGSAAARALQGIQTGLGAARTGLGALNAGAQAVTRSFIGMHRALNGFSAVTKLAGGYFGAQGAMTFTSNVVALEKAMLGVKANIMSGTSSAQELQAKLKEVRETGRDLSKISIFSDTDTVGVVEALLKSNVKLKDIKGKDGAAFATVAMSQVGRADPQTMAANLGALGNVFNFKSGKQYKDLAEHMTKVDDASAYVGGLGALMYNSQLVSARAAATHVDPKEMMSALGYLDSLGGMSGTSLNRFMEAMLGATKQREKGIQALGIDFWNKNKDGSVTPKPLGESIELVRQKVRGMKDEKKRGILLHKIFMEEGERVATLFSTKDLTFQEFKKMVDGSAGAGEKLKVHMEGLGASFAKLKNTAFAAVEENTTSIQKGANWATNKATAVIEGGHGLALGAGVVGAAVLARLAYKKLPGMVANWAGAGASLAGGVAMGKTLEKVAGITPVFVTNMPSGGIGGDGKPTFRKAVVDTATSVGTGAAGAALAGAGTGAAAVAGLGAGAALLMAAPIMLAGGYLQDKMNSPEGLQDRMTAREEKMKELAQLIQLEKSAGNEKYAARLQKEFDAANKDREAFLAALKEKTDQPIHVQVVMPDGRVLTEVVNEVNAQNFRRR